jgi:hypothetical protein
MSATRMFHLTSLWSKARELLNEGQKKSIPHMSKSDVFGNKVRKSMLEMHLIVAA